ncbi:fimbrial protein [uncultured Parabacteroides sp.]|uniref:fimbrial protein n=1 Tax=uncultured Parabacteroides sp. TaxID=512312 RepID=UPI002608C685|nr:fimbrial protein [uncultured Parabacteroides sp.]
MKRYSIQTIFFIWGLLLFAACQDEDLIKKDDVVEGVPVSVVLNVSSFAFDKVETKADMGTVAENKVNDLHIFIFRSDKTLEDQADFNNLSQTEGSGNSGSVVWPRTITSGQKYIVALANVNSDNITGIDYSAVDEFDDLKEIAASLNGDLIQRPSTKGFVMSGYWGESSSSATTSLGLCVIPRPTTEGDKITLTAGKIWLRHLDSKIKFDIQLYDKTNKEFIPRDWKIVNVPKKSNIIEQTTDAATVADDFFETPEAKFEILNLEAQKYLGGSFTFYMLENRKAALNPIDDYAEREHKKDKGGRPEDPFFNADPLSTYVVLRGTYYEYKSNGEIKLSADVRYTIHLGYVNKVASDFNSERNLFYTYTVKVKDVQNIILEVTSSEDGKNFEEKQPGSEGDVIISDQNLLLDAHYEVKTVTFKKDAISNLSVMVRTPYEKPTSTSGQFKIDKENGEVVIDNLNDYQWVEFVKNPSEVKTFADYTSVKSHTDNSSYNNSDDQRCLRDIKQLLRDLYTHRNDNDFWDADGTVTYTVFVNEFYYDKEPASSSTAQWRDFVNCDNRQMHILCDTKYSLDEQSSLTKSNIMINQRSIKTIYNKELSESVLPTAWGIETKCEDGRMYPKRGDYVEGHWEKGKWVDAYYKWIYKTNTKTNGRYNTFQWLAEAGNLGWNNYVDYQTNTNKSTVTAEYACFQRNRDLNGNGKIDPYEVRWYLPATNQYIGLWIGQDALPSEARLLQNSVSSIKDGSNGTKDNRLENHYLSSNGVRFWAEEGVSTGSEKYYGFYVRCARNLGYAHNNEEESAPTSPTDGEVLDYVIPTRGFDKIVTSIDLSRVDPSALRKEIYTSIDFHAEHSGGTLNYPHSSFVVSDLKNGTLSYNKDSGRGSLPSSCPEGYRIPNQRELALIAGYSNANIGNIGAVTYSDLTYKKDLYTTRWSGDGKFNWLTLSGNSVSTVRCVKDY